MRKSIFIFIISCFIIQPFVLKAQKSGSSDFNEFKTAYVNVKEGKYQEAYPYFKRMLDSYPKDPTYNYYTGICLLYNERNPVNALKNLRFAATKEVPDDVYFYLALAYLKNYEFDKALDSFQWFEKRATKSQQKEFDLKNYISMAQNGIYLTKYVRKPSVYSKENSSKENFYKKYQFPDLEGHFVNRDDFFHLKKDSSKANSIMFIPNVLERNEVLYFSDVNKKRGDLDIFRVIRINDTTWSEPENLGETINTPFDEDYPYIHSDGSTLYFASKGHYSMGGYDLYQSSWNWEKQEWTEPENLDFPINSPFDDILFVPSPNKKMAYFATNRQTDKDNFQVLKIRLDNSTPYVEIQSHDEILNLAELKIDIIPEKKEKKSEKDEKFRSSNTEIVKIKNEENFIHRSEYDSLLNEAIQYQLKADSLRWVIDEKRSNFDQTENGQERAKLGNAIIELERKIYNLQKNADMCYERVRDIEQTNLASQKTVYETTNNQDKKVGIAEKTDDEQKSQKLFVEPVDNSIKKSKLETAVVEEPIKINKNIGLKVELPSVYSTKNHIPTNEKLSSGVIYMIQLGAFSAPKSPAVFNGLTPLTCIKSNNSNIRKYFAGKFDHLSDAEKSLPIVKSKGFKDSYIVAFNNGKIIPVNNAVKLESKSLNNEIISDKTDKKEINKDSLSIIYIIKFELSLGDSLLIDQVKKIIPKDKSLYQETKKSTIVIVVKSFASFDEAYPIKKSLEAILNKEVGIYAYFAESQIPLDQARKMTQ